MATYTDTIGFSRGVAAHRAQGLDKISVVEMDLNFVTITAARLAAGATAFAANDILEVIPIPAKTYVIAVGIDVTTADGTANTIDVGDGTTVGGWVAGHNGNTVGSASMAHVLTEGTPNVVIGYSQGKYYAAADTIDIKMLTAPLDAAVIRVWAVLANCA